VSFAFRQSDKPSAKACCRVARSEDKARRQKIIDAREDTVVTGFINKDIKTAWRSLRIDSRQCEQLCRMQDSSIVQVQSRRAALQCLQRSGFASAIQGTDDAVPLRINAKQ
jgi:hypothetical protein